MGHGKRTPQHRFRPCRQALTSRDVCERWAADRKLKADDATLVILRKRIGACIKTCGNQGLVECVGQTTDHDPNGPYKLWRIKS